MNMPKRGAARIPAIGLGTYKLKGDDAYEMVLAALDEGYRHIDTAQFYENEAEIGRALRDSEIVRSEVFVTTKIMPEHFEPAAFRAAVEKSLDSFGMDYVDLLLLHWPSKTVPVAETLGVLAELIDEGLVTNGGVSNFTIPLLEEVVATVRKPIAVNQIELHPFIDQRRLIAKCSQLGIPVAAFSPLAQGRVIDDPVLGEIGRNHGVSAAQISLAWILAQPDGIAVPKTGSPRRLGANLDATRIELSSEEMARIDRLSLQHLRLIEPEELAPSWDEPGGAS